MTLSRIERLWFAKKAGGAQSKEPLNQLKKRYYKSQNATGETIPALENSWLKLAIVGLGETPASNFSSDLWSQLAAKAGARVSRFRDEVKAEYYIKTL